MALPTTDRSKCKHEVKDEVEKKDPPFWKVVVQGMISGVVRYVCSLLLNQRTWHYVAVKLPEWIQSLFDILKS